MAEVKAITDFADTKTMDMDEAIKAGLLVTIGAEVDDAYMAELKKLVINQDAIDKYGKELKIVYTPLHGTGNIPARRILAELGFENVYVVPEQELPDGEFPTVEYPNPEAKEAFTLALDLAKKVDADVVLATDPDADRLGVYAKDSKTGEYKVFTGNMSGSLLCEYEVSQMKAKNGSLPTDGAIIKTIVTTNMVDAIAKEYGTDLIECFTGFKNIGREILKFEETGKSLMNIIVTADDGDTRTYAVPHTGLLVQDGDVIEKGKQLQDGALNPHDVLRIRGASAVHNYLIQEVLKVYRQQGVDINDKHIEVIVRQMMRKVRVEESGDTKLLSGAMTDILDVEDANAEIRVRNAAGETNDEGEPLQEATYTQVLMGITKASLATDSWMSAASFQETTKVLTEAAIKGKVDHLVGLKENVIIGKLIPAGAGLGAYRQLAEELVPDPDPVEEEIAPQEVIFTNQVAAANVE